MADLIQIVVSGLVAGSIYAGRGRPSGSCCSWRRRSARAELDGLASSLASRTAFAENYVGLPH